MSSTKTATDPSSPLSSPLSAPADVPQAEDNADLRPVVLVPGYRDNEHKMRYVEAALAEAGFQVHSLSPQPSDGTVGIDQLAQRLAQQIEETFDPGVRCDYVGFSMGGLIGRYYLQQLGGTARVTHFITVATPHRGTLTAQALGHYPALHQMTPDSDFLAQLNSDLEHLEQTNFRAVWTPFDLSVTPPANAYLPDFPHYRVWSPFHATMLMDPWVVRLLVNLLQEI